VHLLFDIGIFIWTFITTMTRIDAIQGMQQSRADFNIRTS